MTTLRKNNIGRLVAFIVATVFFIGLASPALAIEYKTSQQILEERLKIQNKTEDEKKEEDKEEKEEKEELTVIDGRDSRFIQNPVGHDKNKVNDQWKQGMEAAKDAATGKVSDKDIIALALKDTGRDASQLAIWAYNFKLWENPNNTDGLLTQDGEYLSEAGIALWEQLKVTLEESQIIHDVVQPGYNSGYGESGFGQSGTANVPEGIPGVVFYPLDKSFVTQVIDDCGNFVTPGRDETLPPVITPPLPEPVPEPTPVPPEPTPTPPPTPTPTPPPTPTPTPPPTPTPEEKDPNLDPDAGTGGKENIDNKGPGEEEERPQDPPEEYDTPDQPEAVLPDPPVTEPVEEEDGDPDGSNTQVGGDEVESGSTDNTDSSGYDTPDENSGSGTLGAGGEGPIILGGDVDESAESFEEPEVEAEPEPEAQPEPQVEVEAEVSDDTGDPSGVGTQEGGDPIA